MLKAGKLRHIVTVKKPTYTQVADGSVTVSFTNLFKCYCSIEPISVKELILANTTEHKISVRILIRYNSLIDNTCVIYHGDKIYNIEGIQADTESGIEYLTLACSTGILKSNSET